MLPLTLLCLLQAILGVLAQQTPIQLSLNNLYNFTVSTPTSNSRLFNLPLSRSRFFITNDTSVPDPGPNDLDNPNVFELDVGSEGFASWTGSMPDGGVLAVSGAGQVPYEVGVSDEGPIHAVWDDYPLLGDSTSNQVLLFSPPFSPFNITQPTYPNYTLPPAELSFPQGPRSPPNYTLYFTPTSNPTLASIPRTSCALRALDGPEDFNEGAAESQGLWLRDTSGWRWQWLVNGLTPLTNYTVFALNGSQVSNPINFITKSAAFSCPIVHSLPYCPSTAYAVPIAAPQRPATAHDTTTLPSNISTPLFEVLTNFTTSLLTFPCGRDQYSPLVTCADCQEAYRRWLCSIWFPRCSEASPTSTSTEDSTNQQPISALQAQPTSAPSRSPGLPPFSAAFDVLLPCVETCTAVDRACPNALGFKCPVPRFNANSSYGIGFIDSGQDGVQGKGSTGVAQDIWGNVWCNLG
ncbi:stretch-activated Ca2+-permeable channel component-domain-containing protein [Abortiporus biennis]|nr:stretch-activated Ca2+-permeable channel component-domain-containing protein [Abortiporus biennis]